MLGGEIPQQSQGLFRVTGSARGNRQVKAPPRRFWFEVDRYCIGAPRIGPQHVCLVDHPELSVRRASAWLRFDPGHLLLDECDHVRVESRQIRGHEIRLRRIATAARTQQ